MSVKAKKRGFGPEVRTFAGTRNTYLVFRTSRGAFHVFQEVEAKKAAKDCGAKADGSTRQRWQRLWSTKK